MLQADLTVIEGKVFPTRLSKLFFREGNEQANCRARIATRWNVNFLWLVEDSLPYYVCPPVSVVGRVASVIACTAARPRTAFKNLKAIHWAPRRFSRRAVRRPDLVDGCVLLWVSW